MASNIQRGTRGLSAGDWIRLKRLRGARTFTTDTTTNPDPRLEPKTSRRVYTEVGGSKIRKPASGYTDYIGSRKVDYVLESPSGECGVAKALTVNKLCTCDTTSAIKHNGLCRSCTYDRIVNRNTSGTCVLGTNQNCNACGDACPQGTVCVPLIVRPGYICVEGFPTSFTIPSDYCSMPASIHVVDGATYDIINNTADTTHFIITNPFSTSIVTIPLGSSSVQMPSNGTLQCA